MIYQLLNGGEIDTARELDFEQRNFLQKMMIYFRMDSSALKWRERWRREGNPVWQGPGTLLDPSPAARILLDLEMRFEERG